MRSNLNTGDSINKADVTRYDHAVTKRKRCEHNTYDVMGWPNDKAIPNILSDWLVFLLINGILDKADAELSENEVYTVRYNLGKIQMLRCVKTLISDYPQYVSILKVGQGKMNIWVDGKLTAIIRDGKAYGKKIFVKHYDRNIYAISRALATEEEDVMAALRLFPHAKRHIILNYYD